MVKNINNEAWNKINFKGTILFNNILIDWYSVFLFTMPNVWIP